PVAKRAVRAVADQMRSTVRTSASVRNGKAQVEQIASFFSLEKRAPRGPSRREPATPSFIWGQRSLVAAEPFNSAILTSGSRTGGTRTMKSAVLLTLVLLTASYPAMAKPYHHGHRYAARTVHHASRSSDRIHHVSREARSGITCEMVRAYVAQVGL